jgi:hypothetical protein
VSGFFRAFAFLFALAIAIGIGAAVYNAGVTEGLAEAARQAAASGDPLPVPYGYGYGPYWHGPFGFGFFGPILIVLGLFIAIGFARIAVRGGQRHDWKGPGGWGDRRDRVEAWHRELHRREAGEEPQPAAGA